MRTRLVTAGASAAILMLALLQVACAAKEATSELLPAAAEQRATAGPGAPGEPAPRKLIRTAMLRLAVDDPESAAAALETAATDLGGYVEALSANRHDGLPWIEIVLRVPVARLDETVERARGLASQVDSETRRAEDVTAQFVDLEARLRALHATEKELLELLAESRSRGHDAEDILAIYRQLTEIRTTSEQHQGQLASLSRRVELSRIEIHLRPSSSGRPLVGDRWRPSETVRDSVRNLLAALQTLTDLAIQLVIVVIPTVLLVLTPFWLLVRFWRRRQRRQGENEGDE